MQRMISQPLFVQVTGPGRVLGQYGIAVCDAGGNRLFGCRRLTGDPRRVEALVRMLEEGDIAPVHIADITEDFLS